METSLRAEMVSSLDSFKSIFNGTGFHFQVLLMNLNELPVKTPICIHVKIEFVFGEIHRRHDPIDLRRTITGWMLCLTKACAW